MVDRCDRILAAGGALRRLLPIIQRERILRQNRVTASATAGFRAEATDRPVLDWLLATPNDPRRLCSEENSQVAADRLIQLRTADHAFGAGPTYTQVTEVLGQDLEALATYAPQVATGYLELAGYEAVDLGADGLALRHYLQALEIMTRNGDRLYGGYLIAVSLAHLALHCGDPEQAGRLAGAALRGTEHQSTPAVRAALRTVLARAHARRGDEASCTTALVQVEADLARSQPADEPAWISYFGEADLADEKAHCFFDLGLDESAQRESTRAVALLEPTRVRRLAIDTALFASSLARSRQIEHACAIAFQAIDHAAGVASFRTEHRIVLMLAELQPFSNLVQVRDVTEYANVRLPLRISSEGTDLSP